MRIFEILTEFDFHGVVAASPGLVLFLFRDGRYHSPLACLPEPDAMRRALAEALVQPAEEEP